MKVKLLAAIAYHKEVALFIKLKQLDHLASGVTTIPSEKVTMLKHPKCSTF